MTFLFQEKQKLINLLNPLQPNVAQSLGFLMFSGGIENQHWAGMG